MANPNEQALVEKYRSEFTPTQIARLVCSELGYPQEEFENTRKRISKYINHGPSEAPAKREVIQNQEPIISHKDWKGDKYIRFGLCSDPHLSSKYTQLTHLHKFYDICESKGIETVFQAGDIDDGERMRPGHQYECYVQGADGHINEIVKHYPQRKGMTTEFIIGNHDSSLVKLAGLDIGKQIAAKRPDMKYLGPDAAQIFLTPNCNIELRHPWDGTSYALSYKPQKLIDAMPGGEKPNILAIGHYHKAEYLFYRNVHCFQAGTFCAQTPFMRGKGLAAHVGGWIIEVMVNSNGHIDSIRSEFVPFYKTIKDDYLVWQRK